MSLDIAQQFKILERIGLTEGESNLYIANNTLGTASVVELAQKSGYSRQQVYEIIPRLLELGLIVKVREGKKQHYKPADPENLKEIVGEIGTQIEDLVPVLKSRQATNKAVPELSVYESPIAMREWYINFMEKVKDKDELLVWDSGKNWYELDPKFYQKFLDFKETLNITNLVIAPDTPDARQIAKKISKRGGVLKYRFARGAWKSDIDMWMWRDQVGVLTIRENATNMIVIESKELAELERHKFYKYWEGLR